MAKKILNPVKGILFGLFAISRTTPCFVTTPCKKENLVLINRFFCGILPLHFSIPMLVQHNLAYILLGGNLGNVHQHLQLTIELLQQRAGTIRMLSPVYRSEAWGFKADTFFLNQVVALDTDLTPEKLLEELMDIEKQMGRQRNATGYQSRVMDIDILFYNNQIIHSQTLTVPHPRLHLRNFTLKPLNDIAPTWQHPVLGKTIAELLHICSDPLWAEPVS